MRKRNQNHWNSNDAQHASRATRLFGAFWGEFLPGDFRPPPHVCVSANDEEQKIPECAHCVLTIGVLIFPKGFLGSQEGPSSNRRCWRGGGVQRKEPEARLTPA